MNYKLSINKKNNDKPLIVQIYELKLKLSISSINVDTTILGGQLMKRIKIKLPITDAKGGLNEVLD